MNAQQGIGSESRKGFNLKAALAAQVVVAQEAVDMTFGELCRAYLAAHYDGADMQLRKWIDAFGDLNAWSLSGDELVRAGEAMISAGYSPATVNRNLSQVGSVYKWAATKRRLAPRGFISPTRGLPRYPEPCHPVDVSDASLSVLVDATLSVKDKRFSALVRLLIDSGARRGEVLERRWADVDLEARTITVGKTKTGVARVLFFSQQTADFMKRVWPEDIRLPEAMLFESKRAPGAPVNFKKHWDNVTTAIGRPDLRLHDLRHYRAKQLIASGVPVAVASQALGHSSMILMRRYAHLETAATQAAIQQSWSLR